MPHTARTRTKFAIAIDGIRAAAACAEGLAVLAGAKCSETCVATGRPCKDGAKYQPCCRGDAICVTVDDFAQCMPIADDLPADQEGAKQVQCRAPLLTRPP